MLKIDKKKQNKIKKQIRTKEQVLVVAQEIKFARLLAGNEKKSRDRAFKTLKKWLINCFQKGYEFKEDDFARVWKGLFYAVWMSDKPLVQEELCDSIAALLDQFPPEHYKPSMLMFRAGLKILATEWYGIDQHRMDKFFMLVRRFLRGAFRVLDRCGWKTGVCKTFAKALTENEGLFAIPTPTYARNALSLLLHITECYLEEIAKVSKGELSDDSIVILLTPFASHLARSPEQRLAIASRKLFNYLIRQSELGQEYEVKRSIWSRMGCPEGGPDALVPASDDEDEDGDKKASDGEEKNTSTALDPRAGHVDVVLSTLPVPGGKLAELLKEQLKTTTASAHRRVKIIYQRFLGLSKNDYPLRVPDDVTAISDPELRLPKAAKVAKKLDKFEKELAVQSDELALRGLSRKLRKRLLARSREGFNIIEELDAEKAHATDGAWQVEDSEEPKVKKRKLENKENVHDHQKQAKKRKHSKKQEQAKKRKLDNHINLQTNHESVKNSNEKAKVNTVKPPKLNKKKDKNHTEKVTSKENHVEEIKTIQSASRKTQKSISLIVNKVKKFQKPLTSKNETNSPPKPDNKNRNDRKKGANQKIDEVKAKVNNLNESKDIQATPQKVQKTRSSNSSTLVVNKLNKFQKSLTSKNDKNSLPKSENKNVFTPKRVKFALKNNSMQGPVDYYKSVRKSPSIPFDSSKKPRKTNLKPNSTPSPINPFFKKKLRSKS